MSKNTRKGISVRKNGKFEAYVNVTSSTNKNKRRPFKAYIGVFDTESEAFSARQEFINNLK